MAKANRGNSNKTATCNTWSDELLLQVLVIAHTLRVAATQCKVTKVGKMGERFIQESGYEMATNKIQGKAKLICALAIGTSIM